MKYWNQELPESDLPKSQTLLWMPSDTEEAYDKNQPQGWGKNSIEYRINSHGYRGTEFTDSANFKILVSGCSHTLGVGIPEEDIWCNQFSQNITGAKVYNLALGGRSPDYVVRSIYKSIDILQPNLVMVMWPDISRFERPSQDGTSMAWWTANDDFYLNEFTDPNYQLYNFEKNQLFLEHLCKSRNVPLIAFSHLEVTKRVKIRDFARDMSHDGPKWNQQAANVYWREFQKLF